MLNLFVLVISPLLLRAFSLAGEPPPAPAAAPVVSAAAVAPAAPPSSEVLWPGTDSWAESVLAAMPLERKVGQLFVTNAAGTAAGTRGAEWNRLTRLVREMGIGGVIFMRGDAARQANATRRLQGLADVPLLVAQDMEFGAGMRLDGATAFPNAMALGATRSPELAYALGRAVAEEARALGVHQNYAPVADVNNNPANPIINVRSFGESPSLVADLTTAYVWGMQEAGLVATVKHFPGHGDTNTDSHAALPRLDFSRERLDAVELVPFRQAIAGGVMSVMTGHLAIPALEPDPALPATLSRRIITGLLRDELGFDGLVVTDGLDMRGVTGRFSIGEVAVRALEAGVDQLILTRNEDAAHAAVLAAVRSGRLSEARIDASVGRILRAKAWLGLDRVRANDFALLGPPPEALRRRSDVLAAEIARRAVTLLRNDGDVLPLAGPRAPRRILTLILDDGPNAETGAPFAAAVAASVPSGGAATHRRLGPSSPQRAYDDALALVRSHDVVLVPAFVRVRSGRGTVELPPRHRAFAERLARAGRPVVLIAFGNPYIAAGLPQTAAYVAAYGGNETMQQAVADALLGRSDVTGRLPVTIPGRYRIGDGLTLRQQALRSGAPEEAGMDAAVTARVDSVMRAALARRVFPGAAVAVGRGDVLVHAAGYGRHTYEGGPAVTSASVFDLASVTKVVGTTAAVMRLVDEGRIEIDAPVARYLPAFAAGPDAARKRTVTVRHLLAHEAGHRAFHPFHTEGPREPAAILDFVYRDRLGYEPGARTLYSDFDMIVLGALVEAVVGEPLDAYLHRTFFGPMGMSATGFRPVGQTDERVVPTERDRTFRRRLVQGEVHDEAAWLLGGVAGHAGLFSSAADLARFASVLAGGGEGYGRRFFREETLRRFTRRASTRGRYPMALGWMATRPASEGYSSAGTRMGPNSFGHTGFTGTSLWIDPDTGVFVILLSNRVYPTREGNRIAEVRAALADAVAGSVQAPAGAPADLLGFAAPAPR